MIVLDDESTWPAHEDDGTGHDRCVADCARCQLIVLREEAAISDRPLEYFTGAFAPEYGQGDFALGQRIKQIEDRLAGLGVKPRPPRCYYNRHTYADDICIYCGAPKKGPTTP